MRPGAEPLDWESRVDRRTACLHQADAFREKAIADPEHHDQWIDEAIKWLERAMEAGCRAVVTLEAGDVGDIANATRGASADAQLSLITRQ
jgi:5,10-methylenetetrahydrofolate reductase